MKVIIISGNENKVKGGKGEGRGREGAVLHDFTCVLRVAIRCHDGVLGNLNMPR